MNELVKIENNDIAINQEFIEKLINFEKLKKEIEYQSALLKSELLEIMPKLGKTTLPLNGISITYKKAFTRKAFDSKSFKEDNPEEYEKYIKESEVNPTIIFKVED